MALTHYLDVVIRMPEIANDLHGRLLHLAHSRICKHSDLLVASWPDMKHNNFGFVFRVLGSSSVLENFALACKPLIDRAMVRLYPVTPIPDHASHDHYFARERVCEKNTPAFLRRVNARCVRRGVEPFKPRAPAPGHYPLFLQSQSGSNGQSFTIYIKRMSGPAPEGAGGKNYGLGLTVPSF